MLVNKKGFTLIEFMVAMSLVSILSTMAIGNFMGSQKRGRDVRRQSDLNQYRVALENWSSNNQGAYPASTNLLVPDYLASHPTEPQGGAYRYSSDAAIYVLDACVEVQKKLYQICSNGKSGITTLDCSVAIDSNCDL
ncbi:MAG: type II secretion system protein [Candidatus Amesbacteria bacterium]|nr:type II secretion system protein [Candidatus Amesbacteria bacterium]